MNVKQQKNLIAILIAIFATCFVSVACIFGAGIIKADNFSLKKPTFFDKELYLAQAQKMTESDILLGETSNLDTTREFFDRAKSYYYEGIDDENLEFEGQVISKQVYFQRDLLKVIPEYAFLNEGTHFYDGVQYAFIVTTKTYYLFNDNAGNTERGELSSHILVLDKYSKYDEKTASFSFNTKQYELDVITFLSTHNGELKFLIENNSVTNLKAFSYLKNVTSCFNVKNEHATNFVHTNNDPNTVLSEKELAYEQMNKQYSKLEDEGVVINQARMNYKGAYITDAFYNPSQLYVFLTNTVLNTFPIPLSSIVQFSKTMCDIVLFTDSLSNACINSYESGITQVEVGNEANITDYYTKEYQKNNDNMEFYAKSLVVRPADDKVCFNDSIQTIVKLSDSNVESRFEFVMAFELLQKGNSGFDSSTKRVLNEDGGNMFAIDFTPMLGGIVNDKDITYDEYGKIVVSEERVYEFNKDCYLLEGGFKKMTFVPEKTGNYNITSNNGGVFKLFACLEEKSEDKTFLPYEENKFLIAGKEYIFEVKMEDPTAIGIVSLDVEFNPSAIEAGVDCKIDIFGNDTGYNLFTPTESGVYFIDFSNLIATSDNEGENIQLPFFRIVERDSGANVHITFNSSSSIFFQAGKQYEFSYRSENDFDVAMNILVVANEDIDKSFSIKDGYSKPAQRLNEYYKFTAIKSGDYEFKVDGQDVVDVRLYDEDYNLIASSGVGFSRKLKSYLAENQTYYFVCIYYGSQTQSVVNLKYLPVDLKKEGTVVENILNGYNVLKFVPEFSGKFNIKTNILSNVQVFDENWNVVLTNNFVGEKTYFIKISTEQTANYCTVVAELDCDKIMHNTDYEMSKGINVATFVPKFSGLYEVVGVSSYKIRCLNNVIWCYSGGVVRQLNAGETYIIELECENDGDNARIRFNPYDAELQVSNVISNGTYYTLNVTTQDEYTINSKPFWGDSKIVVYDENLEVVASEFGTLIKQLGVGRYYVYIDASNIDTLVTITSKSGVSSLPYINFQETNKKEFVVTPTSPGIVRYVYDKNSSVVRFDLKINEVLSENINVSCFYYKDGNKFQVELVKSGEVGRYHCSLFSGVEYFEFIIESPRVKSVTFDLYVPAFIQRINVDGHDIYTLPNKLRMGTGLTHNLQAIFNEDASYKSVNLSLAGNCPDGVEIVNGSSVYIPYNKTLIGKTVEVFFETSDKNSFRSYLFEIVNSTVATPKINGFNYSLNICDLYGNTMSDAEISKIEYYCASDSSSYLYKTVNGGYQPCDYLDAQCIREFFVYAVITYDNGYSEKTEVVKVTEDIYTFMSSNIYTNKKRVSFDATKAGNSFSSTRISIPSTVEVMNIYGQPDVTYSDVYFYIEKRSTKLIVNLQNFKMYSYNVPFDMSNSDNVVFNVVGINSIQAKGNSHSAVKGKNVKINGKMSFDMKMVNCSAIKGQLSVFGASGNYGYAGGKGIECSGNFSVENAKLNVDGGIANFSSGRAGANGGDAIKCVNFYSLNSSLKLKGGNGASGATGITGWTGASEQKGGTGGNGYAGGTGGSCIVAGVSKFVSSEVTFDRGLGGAGGTGGTGGTGGRGVDGQSATVWEMFGGRATPGTNGGAGGTGGTGGRGGNTGKAVSGTISTQGTSVVTVPKTASSGGRGGAGGAGGAGGRGGEGNFNSWAAGADGATGASGSTGARGLNGEILT